MSATPVKTMRVAQDVREEVLSLFGTVANAAAKLNVPLNYATLSQGFKGLPIRPAEAEMLEEAWRRWKQHYIRGIALGVLTDLNNFELPPQEETDDLSDAEIEEWTRRLVKKGKKK